MAKNRELKNYQKIFCSLGDLENYEFTGWGESQDPMVNDLFEGRFVKKIEEILGIQKENDRGIK